MDPRENLRGVPVAAAASVAVALACLWADGHFGDMVLGAAGRCSCSSADSPNCTPIIRRSTWNGSGLSPSCIRFWTITRTRLAVQVLGIPSGHRRTARAIGPARKVIAETGRVVCRTPTFWLFAFNPAILTGRSRLGTGGYSADGADYSWPLSCTPENTRHGVWLPALGLTALLIKFQAIVFSPLFAALALRQPRRLTAGLVVAALVVTVVLLPFAFAGNLLDTLRRAYTDNVSAYPVSTFNAANIWYLLGQNSQPDDLLVFLWTPVEQGWKQLLTVKPIGIAIFAIVSLWVFFSALLRRHCDVWKHALILALAFFLFAPSMHERYIFPAVLVAAFAAAHEPKRFVAFVLATIVATLNIALVLPPAGEGLWMLTSILGLLLLVWLLLERVAMPTWLRRIGVG